MNKTFGLIFSLMLIPLLLTACSFEESRQAAYYVIDPRFDELYEQLQGSEVLGPPISNKKYVAGTSKEKQYFESAVLVYDPQTSPRYYLEPVGYEAGFTDLPNVDPENPNVRYVNGYIIPMEFAKLYDELGGARWVGLPLTRARKNPERGIVEQYFENLGFFRYEDDPPGVVRLMPYGLWKCAGECSKYPNVKDASVRTGQEMNLQDSPFSAAISRLGSDFTGTAITEPYPGQDQRTEQVFSNLVMVEDERSPMGVSLRPVVTMLGYERDPYQTPGSEQEMYFREVEKDKGYYIPGYFIDFVSRYSGFELSGEPITRLNTTAEGKQEQCFENYCLVHDPQKEDGKQVSLRPLGQEYKKKFSLNSPPPTAEYQETRNFAIDVWEQSPQISSSAQQQVGACIHQGDLPLSGIQVVLNLTTPQNGMITYTLPPTDNGGCSFQTLDSIPAANGTNINYEVCFQGTGEGELCKGESFMIWGNPEREVTPPPTQTPVDAGDQGITLDIWELSPQIPSNEVQEVGACIHEGDQPLVNLGAELMVNTPEEGIILYRSAPTDAGGCSFFKMEPIQAKNGETIPYQVCFTNQKGEKMCQRDSFLIWGNP